MGIKHLLPASERLRGILLLITASILWSTSGFGIKWISWNPMAIAGSRSAVATVVVWLAFRRSPLRLNWPLVCGGVAYALMMLTFVAANKLTTAANAIMLQYTAPVYVAILGAIFLHEQPHLYDWLTMGLVGGGMILFFQDRMSTGGLAGNLLAIGSGICMAVMTVSMRWQKDGSPFGSVLLGNLLTCLAGLPFIFTGSPGTRGWIAIVALGCAQIGLAYILYSIAIKHVTALEAAVVTMIEPVLNPIWVFFLLGEGPGRWAMLGGAVILAAIAARYIVPAVRKSEPSQEAVD